MVSYEFHCGLWLFLIFALIQTALQAEHSERLSVYMQKLLNIHSLSYPNYVAEAQKQGSLNGTFHHSVSLLSFATFRASVRRSVWLRRHFLCIADATASCWQRTAGSDATLIRQTSASQGLIFNIPCCTKPQSQIWFSYYLYIVVLTADWQFICGDGAGYICIRRLFIILTFNSMQSPSLLCCFTVNICWACFSLQFPSLFHAPTPLFSACTHASSPHPAFCMFLSSSLCSLILTFSAGCFTKSPLKHPCLRAACALHVDDAYCYWHSLSKKIGIEWHHTIRVEIVDGVFLFGQLKNKSIKQSIKWIWFVENARFPEKGPCIDSTV